jgi:hypothetical protein
MSNAKAKSTDQVTASVISNSRPTESVKAGGVFAIECIDKDGNLKWKAESKNLVVNQGLQDMNTKYFKGVSYTATWYIGLYGAAASNNPTANDTAASHPGFTEITPYSNATRPACSFGTATTADPSVITNALSVAVFAINATATVGGAFLISDNTKGGTAGVLFSAVDFDAPGDRNVVSGDTINVRYDFTLDAA